ncbi:MAG: hypothetical protein Roseis2KO_08470 [Roseivirga sp.]
MVDEGTVLSISDGSTLTLSNANLTLNGTMAAEQSELYLLADSKDISVEGNSFTLSELSIEGNDHKVMLATSIEVKNELRLVKGMLDLGSTDLILGEENGRISGENNLNRITASEGGEIVKVAELSSPNGVNPGNLGLEITCRQSLGRTEIRRGHLASSLPTGMSAARYFRVIPAANVNEDINLRFYFLDAERNEPTQTHQLWKKSRNRWQAIKTEATSAPTDPTSNWVSGSDFELAERYIVGPEQQLEESLGSIPSAFTPNADGKNDYFEIPWIQNHPDAQVSIFNRWGELVLRQTAYHRSPWNGTHRGKLLPSSTFYYTIRFAAGKAPLKGKISIVR